MISPLKDVSPSSSICAPCCRKACAAFLPALIAARPGLAAWMRLACAVIADAATARSSPSFGQQFEPQRTSHGSSFYQTNLHLVTQSMHGTAARPIRAWRFSS
jgi:hypothetical protein